MRVAFAEIFVVVSRRVSSRRKRKRRKSKTRRLFDARLDERERRVGRRDNLPGRDFARERVQEERLAELVRGDFSASVSARRDFSEGRFGVSRERRAKRARRLRFPRRGFSKRHAREVFRNAGPRGDAPLLRGQVQRDFV